MRIAFVGKGGSGKSLLCSLLIQRLAENGQRILAMDMDTVPGLGLSLGLSPQVIGDAGLPEDLAERVPEKGWQLKEGVDIVAEAKKHAVEVSERLHFLQLGKLPDKVRPASTIAIRYVMHNFREKDWHLVTDLAAGTRQPFFGWGNASDHLFLVVTPSAKSILSAKRLVRLADRPRKANDKGELPPRPFLGLIFNQLQSPQDAQMLREALAGYQLPVLAEIPFDTQLLAAEQPGHNRNGKKSGRQAGKAIKKLADWCEAVIGKKRKEVLHQ